MLMRVIEAELDSGVQESKGNLQAQGEPGTPGSGADWAHGGGVGGSRHRPVEPRRARAEHRPRALWSLGSQGGCGIKDREGSSHLLARPPGPNRTSEMSAHPPATRPPVGCPPLSDSGRTQARGQGCPPVSLTPRQHLACRGWSVRVRH